MSILIGGNGSNTLTGTASSDLILAGNGDDLINGGGGSDLILAGNGNDTIDGGSGDDIILGGNGNDIFIHKVTENIDLNNCSFDFYDGERGSDTLRLVVTAQQAADLQAALNAFSTWNKKLVFNFQDYVPYMDLRIVNIENIQIVINGPVNQAPVAVNASFAINEGDSAISGQLLATDPNVGDTLTFSTSTVVAGFVLNPNGSYTFDAAHPSYNHLAAGVILTLNIPFTVSDGNGGIDSTKALTITLMGTNDAPTALNVFTTLFFEGGGVYNGILKATDVDDGAVLTYGAVGVPTAGFVINADGTYTFNTSDPAYNHLAQGQTIIVSTPFMVTDEHGATSVANVSIEIMGTNDAPVITAVTDKVYDEGAAISFAVAASDVDTGDILTYALGSSVPSWLNIDSSTGLITGTAPIVAADTPYSIDVIVTDGAGVMATDTFTLTVNDVPPPLSRLSDVFSLEGSAPGTLTNILPSIAYSDIHPTNDLNGIMVQTIFENLTGTLNPGDVSLLQSILSGGNAGNTYIELGYGFIEGINGTSQLNLTYGVDTVFNTGTTTDGIVYNGIMVISSSGASFAFGAQEISGLSSVSFGPIESRFIDPYINAGTQQLERDLLIRMDQLTPTGLALLENNLGVIEHVFVAQP